MAAARRPGPGRIRVGLSGWSYPAWKNGFYKGVPRRAWLAHCAAHFPTLEVNATFYRLQAETTLARWREATPKDFRFAVKGHRFATHVRRLADPEEPVARQRANARPLGDKLAVVLWQLPGSLAKDMARLEPFVRALAAWPEARQAIEFRHETWFDDEVAACLAAQRIASCVSDAADWPCWDRATTDLVYVRLHGHEETYVSAYSDAALARWAARLRAWATEGREVFVYFDNDAAGAAPDDAQRLTAMADGEPAAAAAPA